MVDGLKHGIEIGEAINGDTFKVYFKQGQQLDIDPEDFGDIDGDLPQFDD